MNNHEKQHQQHFEIRFEFESVTLEQLPPRGLFPGPMGPKGKAPKKGPKEGPKERGPKEGDHIHWWIPINGFIDGPSMNSSMVHQ